jgi:hypothetical protein
MDGIVIEGHFLSFALSLGKQCIDITKPGPSLPRVRI